MSILTHAFAKAPVSRHRRLGANLAAFGLLTVIGYGPAGSIPASAASPLTDWRNACIDKGSPQGGGQMPRADNCARQQACQDLANAAGRVIFEAGCFGIAPEANPAPSVVRR